MNLIQNASYRQSDKRKRKSFAPSFACSSGSYLSRWSYPLLDTTQCLYFSFQVV